MVDQPTSSPDGGAVGDARTVTDAVGIPLPPPPDGASRCPWCSALLAAPAAACPSCGAHLVEDPALDIPGVTAVDPAILALASRPRKPKRTFGSLLIGDEAAEIPPPSQAELPALAPPDAAVRREIRRMELEAIARANASDGPAGPPPGVPPTPDEPGRAAGEPVAGSADPHDAPAG